jgi:uncharacterized SAM-binding protein YcdF (DUF218 family)
MQKRLAGKLSIGKTIWGIVLRQKVRLLVYPVIVGIFGILIFLREVALFEPREDLKETYDAGVVFFGGFDRKDLPGRDSRKRLNEALALANAGRFETLVIVGGSRKRLECAGSEMLAEEAVRLGFPSDRILVGGESRDSISNLREVEEIALARGWDSLLFVSSPVHVVRLAWLKEREGIALECGYLQGDLSEFCKRKDVLLECFHEWMGYLSVLILPEQIREPAMQLIRN